MEQRPKTIEELKQWYIDRNLPPESVTRFFIGSNYKGAKAFGIYKDDITDKIVVYKNKVKQMVQEVFDMQEWMKHML